MSLTVNLFYKGVNGSARKFAEEMVSSGIVDKIRSEEGNERYEYYFPMEDPETVLLIDRWSSQEAIDIHHDSPVMGEIMKLREKYQLEVRAERYISNDESVTEKDKAFMSK
ncbi:MAG: antibiotic biosynthesis monooxygenase [Erysipelotrichaceae bacterium]|nr:antibiotic biosynthesis monooxygenase [Erysipelotrichaceae bacterium]